MTLRDEEAPAVRVARVRKTSLDKDLRKIERLEEATRAVSRNRLAVGVALLFLAIAGVLAISQIGPAQNSFLMIVAAVIGGYMALTIGANDVANNVGPAVGARALTMTGALVIAAIFECAGALIAGGDVVETISKGIIDPALVPNAETFVWIMMSALLASALWVHLATFLGAPVSTTHAIVGGVLGAGLGGGRRQCRRLVRGGVDLLQLADVALDRRHRRGGAARLHQGQSDLPGGQDRRGAAMGAAAGRAHGRHLLRLSRGEGLATMCGSRTSLRSPRSPSWSLPWSISRRSLGCAASLPAWRTAIRLCGSCSTCR